MIQIDCDFHIHSRFSAATSDKMNLENISKGARQKGLHLVSTGDALNKHWLEEIESLDFRDGVGLLNECYFTLSTEVEDRNRVHHLILFNNLDSVHTLREAFLKQSTDIDSDGRPHLRIGGEEIARAAHKAGALVGPSHAFVPWTSVYKEFNSLGECYGQEGVDFLELGLSADTYLADSIPELEKITFLSNSDAHSPSPHRLGREFNRLEVEKVSFEEIQKAILGQDGRKIVLNVGLDPRLGKYHRTACIKCFSHYTLEETKSNRWRCPKCKGRIKKGVLERISEFKGGESKNRPRYLRIAPLAEIIAKVLRVKSPYSKKVNELWALLVEKFGSEISVLVDSPIEKIREVNLPTAEKIKLFRDDRFSIIEGGGGKYGEIIFQENKESRDSEISKVNLGQQSLDLF
jgi:uncharacterized protein (TIGR00375 family)